MYSVEIKENKSYLCYNGEEIGQVSYSYYTKTLLTSIANYLNQYPEQLKIEPLSVFGRLALSSLNSEVEIITLPKATRNSFLRDKFVVVDPENVELENIVDMINVSNAINCGSDLPHRLLEEW